MKQTILWTITILILLTIITTMETQYQKLNQNYQEVKFRLDSTIKDATNLESNLTNCQLNRSMPFQDDMNSEEFLNLLIEHLSSGGRCNVVVEKVDWSSWAERY